MTKWESQSLVSMQLVMFGKRSCGRLPQQSVMVELLGEMRLNTSNSSIINGKGECIMDKEKADFSFLKIVGTETASGVCGPDGCSIEEHRKQVAMEKQKATENK